jgi:CelD/BcsL family acetyltransferase involved in cellulose biosynthesis
MVNAHTSRGVLAEGEVLPGLERVGSFADARAGWSSLADRRGGIFATWEWNETWWRHFGQGRELLLHACRSDEEGLVAVLPLYAWRRRRPRVVRFVGHGPGDELGPLFVAGAEEAAAMGLRAALCSVNAAVFLGEQLPGDESWSRLLGGPTWRREANPVLQVPASGWDQYLDERSSNFRQQLRRRTRELERAGDVRFRLADSGSLERDLDTLFALHRARWGGRGTNFGDAPFHRDVARVSLERGWLRLWLLELDTRPVAAWLGFHVGSVGSYYQAGRDPTYERLSVGFVLLAHSLRAAMDEGATEYRFGRGAEDFKYRFTRADPGLETVTLARGPLGRATLRIGRGARALRRARLSRRARRRPQ